MESILDKIADLLFEQNCAGQKLYEIMAKFHVNYDNPFVSKKDKKRNS